MQLEVEAPAAVWSHAPFPAAICQRTEGVQAPTWPWPSSWLNNCMNAL